MVRKKKTNARQEELPLALIENASLVSETERRYLNYALSVITARALPDVRDGLKPVQRRILFTMFHELRLRSDAKYRKSAAIVGDVMAKFHPHGGEAIYDALVRLAQNFTMRTPLVDGRGNYGSPDGDSAAAMRYTEAKLQPIADELLIEFEKKTVALRPNYDGTKFEPIVLPARFPNLLCNGSQGIAVGMATSIPPHNLNEIIQSLVALIDDENKTTKELLRLMKGADFPTGGELVATNRELVQIYEQGQGSFRLRGTWELENDKRGIRSLVIDSIPYGIERNAVVLKIADEVISKRLPMVLDVRDESTDQCRIVCELRKEADEEMVAAYLRKHTPFQINIPVNLTCLVPTQNPEVSAPKRVGLKESLRYFLDFRFEVVTKRLQFELDQHTARIHILRGFAAIFDALDEVIRIIRKSDGKQDAADKLKKHFKIDEEQTDAILELKLYRLAKLQILMVREELAELQKEAARLKKLLGSSASRWKLIREELGDIAQRFGQERRTKIVSDSKDPEFASEDFIVDEDAMVLVTRQGWVKRQQAIRDLSTTRMRPGDEALCVVAGSTKATVAFFSSAGVIYTARITDIPATTGHGVALQTLFKLDDGERVVAAVGMDKRFLDVPDRNEGVEEPEPPFAFAVTKRGMGLRFSMRGYREVSNRAGRKYARLKEGDEVVSADITIEKDRIACVTQTGRALIFEADELPLLSGPGRGVIAMRVAENDVLLGAKVLRKKDDSLKIVRESGGEAQIKLDDYETVSRGGKGFQLFKRGSVERVDYGEPLVPTFPEAT